MTTDEEEGRRQIAAMQPEPIKVGDKVRLAAGGREMTVISTADYQNLAECIWYEPDASGRISGVASRDVFPVRALVRLTE